jgi:DNA (cytosine-5)-methyltransferase 1
LDFETEAYSCAALVLRADAVGAAHLRKRLYWLAKSSGKGREGYQPRQGISQSEITPSAIDGNPLARARRALGGDYGDLLPFHGVSVAVERCATKGYGNAIVPQVCSKFIKASMT